VQTKLPLQSAKAGFFLLHAGFELGGAVPVADRDIAMLPEGMIGQAVLRQVAVDATVVANRGSDEFSPACSAAAPREERRG
jgi:hypothetical protein